MGNGLLLNLEAHVAPLIDFLRAHPEYVLPVVFLFAFGECVAFVSLLVPATVFFSLFGAFAGAAGLDLKPIAITAAIGAGCGFWISYWIGEKLGPEAAHHWPFTRHPDMLPRGHAFFEKWGWAGIFLGHFFGPVRAVVALVAGICTMPQLPFQLANWAASTIWGFGLVYGAGFIGQRAGLL